MSMFTDEEETRISDAIGQAERTTSGEIIVIVTAQSDAYLYVPPLTGALASLLVPWVLIYFTSLGVSTIYLAQLCVFLAVTLLTLPPRVRSALALPHIKRLRAHRHAREQFIAQNLHKKKGHTGVLIFVSVAERHVEIIADAEIDRCVAPGTWQATVDELTAAIGRGQAADGVVAAIAAVGAHLAQHFPPKAESPKTFPNHLIVLH